MDLKLKGKTAVVTSEEPEKFNAALAEFFAEAERGGWLSHKPVR